MSDIDSDCDHSSVSGGASPFGKSASTKKKKELVGLNDCAKSSKEKAASENENLLERGSEAVPSKVGPKKGCGMAFALKIMLLLLLMLMLLLLVRWTSLTKADAPLEKGAAESLVGRLTGRGGSNSQRRAMKTTKKQFRLRTTKTPQQSRAQAPAAAISPARQEPRVINASSRVIPTKQTPEAWRTWTDRGHDSALIAIVWQFLLLPDVLEMLKACGKPLCKMLKDITKKKGGWFGAGSFDKNEQLLRLLEYSSSDAASHRAHHALPIMARVLLKLCSESEEIRERFKAHLEATRYCKDGSKSERLSLPFIVVQQPNYDFVSTPANIFQQAAAQASDPTVREQHESTAHWLRDVFTIRAFREAAGLQDNDFFTCKGGEVPSLSFRFLRLNETATHAIFVVQPPDESMLASLGLQDAFPEMPGYPDQLSLGKNRAVWYVAPGSSDGRLWEIYSSVLKGHTQGGINGAAAPWHVFPQWFPHGARKPLSGGATCQTFSAPFGHNLGPDTAPEECNRAASVEIMGFVATSREEPPEEELALTNVDDENDFFCAAGADDMEE